MGSIRGENRLQLILFLSISTLLTHAFGPIQLASAASATSSSEATSSSQPLWSYQVKPNNYANAPGSQTGQYNAMPSIFDAFNGLSQRQGALTSSPFLSILPIILIAAGGFMLLLPLLTMMMASPFGGALGGGYGNGFGYPQVGALNKKRSLADQFGQRGLVDLIEHVSTTIEELSRKYSAPTSAGQLNKRAKALHTSNDGSVGSASTISSNHKSTGGEEAVQGGGSSSSGGISSLNSS